MALELDYTLGIIILGSSLLGFVSGCLGCFAVLRRQSLLGDAISHAALPGVALAFLITLSKNPLVLVAGAFVAGWIGTLFVMLITKATKIKEDAALGIVLSVFFGCGIFLLTIIQKLPTASKAGLDKFLFGNAASLLKSDLITMGILGAITLLLLFLFWKEFKLLTFDPDYATSLGFPIKGLTILLMTLIVLAIVIGLQTVGVVLMSAMIIAPAVAARQWTDKLGVMVLLSGSFGALAGIIGAIISSSVEKLPTGPTIVLVMSAIVVISLFLSPHRGLGKDWLVNFRNRRKVAVDRVLYEMLKLAESHNDHFHPHDISAIKAINATGVERSLQELKNKGFVNSIGNKWQLTEPGLEKAKKMESG